MSDPVVTGTAIAAVPARWASHPVVRGESHGWRPLGVWSDDDGLLLRLDLPGRDGDGLWGVGAPAAVARLLRDAAPALGDLVRVSLPRGTGAALAALDPGAGLDVLVRREAPVSAWDWFWTSTPPAAQPGEERVTELAGDDGLAAVAACLDVANPHAELRVTTPGARWWGWHDDDGTVRGVAGAYPAGPGVPFVLGSVATDPATRGRGVAAATTAAATRAGLDHAGLVTLGMYADNDAARRVYERLGYAVGQAFESWR